MFLVVPRCAGGGGPAWCWHLIHVLLHQLHAGADFLDLQVEILYVNGFLRFATSPSATAWEVQQVREALAPGQRIDRRGHLLDRGGDLLGVGGADRIELETEARLVATGEQRGARGRPG